MLPSSAPPGAVADGISKTWLQFIYAEFHGIGAAERELLLPTALQLFTSPGMRAITPVMGKLAMTNCRKRGDVILVPQPVAWYERALQRQDTSVDWWTREPLTLVHGDAHPGNHFLYRDEAGMLDWQAVQGLDEVLED